MKSVSVIIVTRDRRFDLLQCLGSLLTQTVPVAEIIVVSSRTTIETKKIIHQLSRHVSISIRFIEIKERNTANSRNLGLAMTISPWVSFIYAPPGMSAWRAPVSLMYPTPGKRACRAMLSDRYLRINIDSYTRLCQVNTSLDIAFLLWGKTCRNAILICFCAIPRSRTRRECCCRRKNIGHPCRRFRTYRITGVS